MVMIKNTIESMINAMMISKKFSARLLLICSIGSTILCSPEQPKTKIIGATDSTLPANIKLVPVDDELHRPAATIRTPRTNDPFKAYATDAYLGEFVQPWSNGNPDELIDFDFEDADLLTIVHYIEERFELRFIMDDILTPAPVKGAPIKGVKLSFKTNRPLKKKDAWALFTSFLDVAGFTVVPGPIANTYRIIAAANAKNEPLPTFIGVNPKFLPNDDSRIRYIYFVHNVTVEIITKIFSEIQSVTAPAPIPLPEVRGVLITDKAYNIRSMIEIAEELDQVTMPETMSVVKLLNADATEVAAFYAALAGSKDPATQTLADRLANRTPPTMTYFQSDVRVIAEPRTNSLILLGTENGIKKTEEFIRKHLDSKNTLAYSPIHVYRLKYLPAKDVAQVLLEALKFKTGTTLSNTGGVRSGDRYLRPISITPEETGNRLIINCDYEDYLALHEILEKVDIEQPQVALRVMVVEVDLADMRAFGAQIRNKTGNGLFGNNVNFQTSGLNGNAIVEKPDTSTSITGAARLLGDLVKLASGMDIGSVVFTLGQDINGVWGMFRILQTYTQTNVISTPFVVTGNNQKATLKIGEKRRVVIATTIGATGNTPSFDDIPAYLTVELTPRISYEGFISLNVHFDNTTFITGADNVLGNTISKTVDTNLIMGNNEVAVLGGLLKNVESNTERKSPFWTKIPFVGWIGKDKSKGTAQSSLLLFISAEVIQPNDREHIVREITDEHTASVNSIMVNTKERYQTIDPIHRWLFRDHETENNLMSDFMKREGKYLYDFQKEEQEEKGKKPPSKGKRLDDFV